MATTGDDAGTGLRGRFWLQGEPEDKAIPGRLFLQAGANPQLELDGMLTPVIRETSRRSLPDGTEVRTSSPVPPQELTSQSLTVHGIITETGEPVTLPSAFTIGWTLRGTGSQSQRLQAFYAVLGGHVSGPNAEFTRIRLRLRNLDAWANLPGFTIIPDLSAGKYALAYEPAGVASAAMADGARVTLEQEMEVKSPTPCGGQLERRLWVDVLDMPPATYRALDRSIVQPLVNLLTLAVDGECPLVEMMISAGPDHPWLTVLHAAMKASAAEIIPPQRILLPMAEIGLKGTVAWLEASANLGPLPSIVARVASSQGDTVESQLLELTTAAEGLHRLLMPEQVRMTGDQAREARSKAVAAVKELGGEISSIVQSALSHIADQSYPRRLIDLADKAKDAVPGVTGNTAKWKNQVSNTRNGLAHQLEHGFFAGDADAQEPATVMLSLRWLLTGVLLLQTGITPASLGHRIASHQPYQLFLAQARTWLSAVYVAADKPDA